MGFSAEDIPNGIVDDVEMTQSLVRNIQLSLVPNVQLAQSLVRNIQLSLVPNILLPQSLVQDIQLNLVRNIQLNLVPNIQLAQILVPNVQLAQSLVQDIQLNLVPNIQLNLVPNIQLNLVPNIQLAQILVPHIQLAKSFLAQFNDWAEFTAAFEKSETLSDITPDTSLSRSQKRFLFGYFVYSVVLSLCVLAAVRLMESNATNAEALALLTTVTGWSGLSLAKAARDAAFRIFDATYPPDEP